MIDTIDNGWNWSNLKCGHIDHATWFLHKKRRFVEKRQFDGKQYWRRSLASVVAEW